MIQGKNQNPGKENEKINVTDSNVRT